MAQTGYTPIQLYHSTTATNTPLPGDLVDGELAINTADEKLYFKNSGGTVKLLASSAGASGNVVGPASAVDGDLVAFDGVTGKLIKQAATVSVSQGGTGATSLTSNNVLLGNGTSALQVVAPGASGNVLTSNGTTWTSAAPSSSGGFSSVSVIGVNTSAANKVLYVFTASLTLTLPSTPTVGDYVGVSNSSGTTTCVIGRNGSNIMSLAEDMTVDVVDAGFTLYYADATRGWVIL